MTQLLASGLAADVLRGLRDAAAMAWQTLWALVLGFTLSGVVQAFVSKDQMRARLGNHRPAAVARAAGYGMVSSSCSYAASAMTKSLVVKGADLTTALVFMLASTNLVLELGLVLWVLMGWQFVAAEFVGGPIMIVLVAAAGGLVLAVPLVDAARAHLAAASGDAPGEQDTPAPGRARFASPAAWSNAARYAVADATMLRWELVVGFLVAGMLAAVVPAQVWGAVFLHGHGVWTSVENALVGPLIAVVSWVCSVGNVPLAAALWSQGISFGGVVAFLFADLIAMPLILIYRLFYGGALTARIVGLLYVAMVLAGLATEALFAAVHLVPEHRPLSATAPGFAWDATTVANLAALVLAGAVWWLARHAERYGGGRGYGIDPVCGMQVRLADAPARVRHAGVWVVFCSDRCRDRFTAEPHRFTSQAQRPSPAEGGTPSSSQARDPVCGMAVDPATAAAHRRVGQVDYYFCGQGCAQAFDATASAGTSGG